MWKRWPGSRASPKSRRACHHSVQRQLDYSVEHWTRTCEVFAWVSWEDASGRQHTERVQQQATVTDSANQAYPEAGIAEDLRHYGVLDEELIAQADLALAGDIRSLIAADALADERLTDTGRQERLYNVGRK